MGGSPARDEIPGTGQRGWSCFSALLGLTAFNTPTFAIETTIRGRPTCCTLLESQPPFSLAAGKSPLLTLVAASDTVQRESPAWGVNKSYLIPAIEIPVFILVTNGFARIFSKEREDGKRTYASTPSTTWDHLIHGPWVIDSDSFGTNQFGHPYHGSLYHGFSRSAGLGYWESAAYTLMGSFLWETAGETLKPSINDQVASGIAGSFLGEPLFRMASLLLERGKPGFWRELGAALISPPTGFNRLVFGDRFQPVFPSHNPAVFWSAQIGAALHMNTGGSNPGGFDPSEVTGDFTMSYGLPGKPGYTYRRPFDYFQFGLTAVSTTNNPLENLITQGLLFGSDYEVGDNYRGVWGLYGSYDYVSPHAFRVSTTAVSAGTTGQWWLSPARRAPGLGHRRRRVRGGRRYLRGRPTNLPLRSHGQSRAGTPAHPG